MMATAAFLAPCRPLAGARTGLSSSALVCSLSGPQQPAETARVRLVAAPANTAIQPQRRVRKQSPYHEQQTEMPTPQPNYESVDPNPPAGRANLFAPAKGGILSLIPVVAVTTLVAIGGYFGQKKFAERQSNLVDEYAAVAAHYGTDVEAVESITKEYCGKLGPGLARKRMLAAYLRSLVEATSSYPDAIRFAKLAGEMLLGRKDEKTLATVINQVASSLQDSPSVLTKLLFVSERLLTSVEGRAALDLKSKFPYSVETVDQLQENLLSRTFRDMCDAELVAEDQATDSSTDITAGDYDALMFNAAVLKLSESDAATIYQQAVDSRRQQLLEEEAAEAAEAESSEKETPEESSSLDSPARSGTPAKAIVHAYECGDCGYTIYPAAGREFKFFGSDFVCPACGAPKDRFFDVNAQDEADATE